ncbi:MAG: hypothetical protein FJ304_22220 [Planctomycetes bacterium]|nr:hypothetical protein [Planctomycetota bacterium]
MKSEKLIGRKANAVPLEDLLECAHLYLYGSDGKRPPKTGYYFIVSEGTLRALGVRAGGSGNVARLAALIVAALRRIHWLHDGEGDILREEEADAALALALSELTRRAGDSGRGDDAAAGFEHYRHRAAALIYGSDGKRPPKTGRYFIISEALLRVMGVRDDGPGNVARLAAVMVAVVELIGWLHDGDGDTLRQEEFEAAVALAISELTRRAGN